MTRTWTGSNGGVAWTLDLERDDLIPGRLVPGRLRLVAERRVQGRGIVVTLRGEERWRYETSDGKTTTEKTDTASLPLIPVRLSGPVSLEAGETLDLPFELPAPPLGPPTVVADKAAVEWTVEAKLDREGFDASLEVPVRVLQPTALLRAGVVPVEAFALFEGAAGDTGGDLEGLIHLDPVPLVAGADFTARVRLRSPTATKVRAIRGELKVHIRVTVSGGMTQDIVAWSAQLAGPTTVEGDVELAFAGSLPPGVPPTVVLPHSTVQARFELILDRPWVPDSRLGRDVAVAGTAEV
jgi:hypothetical protein